MASAVAGAFEALCVDAPNGLSGSSTMTVGDGRSAARAATLDVVAVERSRPSSSIALRIIREQEIDETSAVRLNQAVSRV